MSMMHVCYTMHVDGRGHFMETMSLLTSMWVPGAELGLLGFVYEILYPLSHLNSQERLEIVRTIT